ncbi:MAG: Spy/CpxP family protein refolding chaperone [Desulfuromonadales bacterium]|nr:Spy/CpxP family protein refolding chaperone [Desulfuromonadales bacterium]
MKTKLKSLSALAALVAAVSFSPMSAMAMGDGECMHQNEQHFKKMETELGLSAQQKQSVKDLHAKCRAQNEPLMKQMGTERRALRTLIHADTVNEAAIRAQSGKIAAIEADLAVQRAQAAQLMRALLTPEQVKKLKAIQEKHTCGMGKTPPCGEGHHKRNN